MKFKKKTNYLLAALIVLMAAMVFYLNRPKDDNLLLRVDLLTIDSAAVDRIQIIRPKSDKKDLDLYKRPEGWMLALENDQWGTVDQETLNKSFYQLQYNFTPIRLAAEDSTLWQKYGVAPDSTVILKVYENQELTYELLIGDFSFQDESFVNTYVRKPDDERIFAVKAYFQGTLGSTEDDWRSNHVISVFFNDLDSMFFDDGKDTYFVKSDKDLQKWTIGENKVPENMLQRFLREEMAEIKLHRYANPELKVPDRKPNRQIKVYKREVEPITINMYRYDEVQWMVNSSENPGNYFLTTEERLDRLFPKRILAYKYSSTGAAVYQER